MNKKEKKKIEKKVAKVLNKRYRIAKDQGFLSRIPKQKHVMSK